MNAGFATLAEFDAWMQASAQTRRRLAASILEERAPSADARRELQQLAERVFSAADETQRIALQLGPGLSGRIDASYEITEFRKDLRFLECAVAGELDGFFRQLNAGAGGGAAKSKTIDPADDATTSDVADDRADSLQKIAHWITDRDGTINPYCGRYLSSVQSVYNAVATTRFAASLPSEGLRLILTSAPLENGGLIDVATAPPGVFDLAGSKGREVRSAAGRAAQTPIDPAQAELLERAAQRIESLLETDRFQVCRWVGSGFQRKVGQLTVARQDHFRQIPEADSRELLEAVRNVLHELDPDACMLRLEDTGKDLEILLTVPESDGREWDKADGLRFALGSDPRFAFPANPRAGSGTLAGRILVCGDTASDLSLITGAAQAAKDPAFVESIFVTDDARLQAQTRETCANHGCPSPRFFRHPDQLIALLWRLAEDQAAPAAPAARDAID